MICDHVEYHNKVIYCVPHILSIYNKSHIAKSYPRSTLTSQVSIHEPIIRTLKLADIYIRMHWAKFISKAVLWWHVWYTMTPMTDIRILRTMHDNLYREASLTPHLWYPALSYSHTVILATKADYDLTLNPTIHFCYSTEDRSNII